MGLAKQITGNAMFRAIFLVFQLLNTVLISRLTGPGGFGIFSLLIVNASFLLMLTSLGIPSGILYHASIKDIPTGRLMRIAWLSTLFQLLLIIIAELIVRVSNDEFFIWKSDMPEAGIAGIIYFLSIVLTEKYYALYNGNGQLVAYNRITAFFNILLFLILAGLILIQKPVTVSVVIFVYIAVQFVQFLYLALNFRKPDAPVHGAFSSLYKVATYSLMAFAANLVFFLLTRIDFWILEYYHGKEALGVYALGVRLVQLLLILPALLSSVILPSIAGKTMERTSMEMMFRLLNTFNLVAVIVIGLLSAWIIPLLFGQAFSETAILLTILLPGIFFLSAQTFLATWFAGKGKVSVNIFSALTALAAAVFLDLLLIPAMGAKGAAIASSISYLVCFAYSYLNYAGQEKYPWHSMLARNADIQWLRTFVLNNAGKLW